jgi:hypothetical protein
MYYRKSEVYDATLTFRDLIKVHHSHGGYRFQKSGTVDFLTT